MGLADAGKRARVNMDENRTPQSKIDKLLVRLPDEERDLLLSWLKDTANWSSHMIAKSLYEYSQEQGKDYTAGHSTIERWRILNGVAVS
jgi:hypothetical protein